MSEPFRWRCGHEADGAKWPPSYVALRDCPWCRGVVVIPGREPRYYPPPEIEDEPETEGRHRVSAAWLVVIGFVAGYAWGFLWRWLGL